MPISAAYTLADRLIATRGGQIKHTLDACRMTTIPPPCLQKAALAQLGCSRPSPSHPYKQPASTPKDLTPLKQANNVHSMKPQIKNKNKKCSHSTVCTASPLKSSNNEMPQMPISTQPLPPPEDVSLLLKQQRPRGLPCFPTPGANAGQILAPRTGRWAFLLVSARKNGASSHLGSVSIRRRSEGKKKGDTAVHLE
jgi:hypothetical protein